ncbi:MAG TPA: chemotaxis protein CheD [Geobacteraceae bacterium]
MSNHSAGVRHVNLKPGEIFIGDTPCLVSTLLGSCVAITLFAARHRLGAICHALLPACGAGGGAGCPERFRHVRCAVLCMLTDFRGRGIPVAGIEAKLFGGADMFPGEPDRDGKGGRGTVGGQNVAMAENLLGGAGIRVAIADVGGVQGRKILFRPDTGEVFLRRLDRMAPGGRGETVP